jgi:hypothetical protein
MIRFFPVQRSRSDEEEAAAAEIDIRYERFIESESSNLPGHSSIVLGRWGSCGAGFPLADASR